MQDSQNKWYEAMIRGLRITQDKRKEIAVHYLGWSVKFDEWVDCKYAEKMDTIEPRIAKRNTNTIGPHRPRKR